MTVRILQVVSVLALIAAAAVSALCLFSAWRGDPYLADKTALSPIERFKQTGGRRDQPGGTQLSPLVKQAQIYAAYLNPPPAAERKPAHRSATVNKAVAQAPQIKPANTSAKFKLRGISYRPSRPEDSMALVWQPDTGNRWVKEGTQLGHITIVEVNGDSVLYTDGTNTQAMTLDLEQDGVMLASGRKDKRSPRDSDESKPVVAHWAPVRRIRQIPATRAARRGVVSASSDMETP